MTVVGVSKGMLLPVKFFCSAKPLFVFDEFHGNHRIAAKIRQNLATLSFWDINGFMTWCLSFWLIIEQCVHAFSIYSDKNTSCFSLQNVFPFIFKHINTYIYAIYSKLRHVINNSCTA